MGKITCANVLSDMFAMGVTRVDNMLMLLGVSTDMTTKELDTVVPIIMRGFADTAREVGSSVNGGQTVKNPWMLLGGVATSVVDKSELIPFDNAQVGNVLVLTKPLGTRIVGNAFQWYDQKMPRWEKIKHVISTDELKNLYLETGRQMASLNLKAAKEMHNHGANACTDITGFGILGHAENLVSFQKNPVTFSIHTLPLLKYTKEIAEKCEIDFKLIEGYCAETSGGLLICLPEDKAKNFCEKMMREDGSDGAWIIGDVLAGDRKAIISGSPKILTVSPVF